MKEMIEDIERLFVLWTLGFLGGILFFIFRLAKRIEITGFEIKKFIPPKEGLIVIYNHPSLWEPGAIVFLLFPWFLFYKSLIPYSAPDKTNFYDKWWFWSVRLFCVPIVREGEGRVKSLKSLIKKMKKRRTVLFLAPEGGRTHKGKNFKIIEDGEVVIKSKVQFPCVRRFQRGVSLLLQKTQAPVLPIWTEGGDKVIPNKDSFPKGPYFLSPNLKAKPPIFKIGKRIKTTNVSVLEDELLKLSQKGKLAH